MEEKIYIKEYKEYENLNGYYLKLEHNNKDMNIIIYNIEKLDGKKYEIKIKLNEIYLLNKLFKSFNNIKEIYEAIIKLINNNKYKIEKINNEIIFIIIIKDIFDNNNEIKFILKNINKDNDEYINILSNEINNMRNNIKLINELKEENKIIKEEINELKNKINEKYIIEEFNKKFNLNIKDNNNIIELNLVNKKK